LNVIALSRATPPVVIVCADVALNNKAPVNVRVIPGTIVKLPEMLICTGPAKVPAKFPAGLVKDKLRHDASALVTVTVTTPEFASM
jgi:hypothetical protein